MPINILGVAGSLREGSSGRRALQFALQKAEAHGANARLLDLRETPLPFFVPRERPQPNMPGARALQHSSESVAWADAFILGTPDYHGSMSGALKNFLDFYHSEFSGKLFGYICTSHDKGLTAMEQVRTAVRQCYGWSLPYGVAFDSSRAFDESGNIADAALTARLAMMARDLTVYGELIRVQFRSDLAGTEADTFAARYRPVSGR